ncbi:MAG: winged helix family transcriptional regulator [Pedobacter sp.]|nr:MAG: winged helix family transcriptional regulator [Pedobacter sp.]
MIAPYKKHLFLAALFIVACGLCAFSLSDNQRIELAKREILLRKIGHELLIHAGDSVSRVLPIKHLSDDEYQITFDKEFSFKPDSLVAIVNKTLGNQHYILNVRNCVEKETVYGYAILGNGINEIVPCLDRVQPKNCYTIHIKFESTGITQSQTGYLLGSVPVIALLGFVIAKSKKSRKTEQPAKFIVLGSTHFDAVGRTLNIRSNTISLTHKENKLLQLLSSSPNGVVERSKLQKEIWEDEGVIVGRSLDVFISKLRKKLECDPTLRIVNVHNKGYKLEITETA